MTAQHATALAPHLSLSEASALVADQALTASPVGPVGLELEFHLVDLRRPQRRITWPELRDLLAAIPPMPNDATITTEPGGQLELSGLPKSDVSAAIAALRADRDALAAAVRSAGFGLASIGADPARSLHRVTPASRYAAMEHHFDAVGCGRAGRQMMTATAALQVNLNAGPERGWADRVAHAHRIGPTLLALSASSPLLAGCASGWQSMRQQAWRGIEAARTRALRSYDDPSGAWASYALAAPVMLVRDESNHAAQPIGRTIPFSDWVAGRPSASALDRAPTVADLDYHLTTLFPPVRLRGYLELRFLDSAPDRWWPALAAITTTLMDDAIAADEAADATAACAGMWLTAARDGLRNETLRMAALRCVTVAARRCLANVQPAVEAYAELIERGRTPGDDVRDVAQARGPLAALVESVDA